MMISSVVISYDYLNVIKGIVREKIMISWTTDLFELYQVRK